MPPPPNQPPTIERRPGRTPSWLWLASSIAAALFFGLGGLYLFGKVAHVLAVLVLGITLASTLAPAVDSLMIKLPRLVAVISIYIVLVALIAGVAVVITPVLVLQARDLIARLPQLMVQVQTWLLVPKDLPIPSLDQLLSSSLGTLGSIIVSLPFAMFNSLLDVSLVLFISLYWLVLSPQLMKYVLSLYPQDRHARVQHVLQRIGQSMGGYLRASFTNGLIIGLLTYIGLVIIGVPFPAVLSLLMGVLEIIPALGPTVAGFFIVLVALLQSPKMALIALVFVIVLQQLEGNILVPNIMRRATDISPLLVILALLAGSTVGGLIGALVSIPIVAALKVIIDEIAAPAFRQWMGAAELE